MGKALRDEELAMIIFRQLHSHMLAVGRRPLRISTATSSTQAPYILSLIFVKLGVSLLSQEMPIGEPRNIAILAIGINHKLLFLFRFLVHFFLSS